MVLIHWLGFIQSFTSSWPPVWLVFSCFDSYNGISYLVKGNCGPHSIDQKKVHSFTNWLLINYWLSGQLVDQSQLTILKPNPISRILTHYAKSCVLVSSWISSFTSQFDLFMFMSMSTQNISWVIIRIHL